MSLSLFKKIVPVFSMTKWVYLQGWGEPLLNRNIWQMASLARKAGTKVGLTTNGALLDEASIEQALNSLDYISISMAEGFDSSQAVKQLVLRRGGRRLPRIEVSQILTRERVSGLVELVESAAGMGVDAVYLTNLDYVYSNKADAERVFSWKGGARPEHSKLLTLARVRASRHKLPLQICSLSATPQSTCDLDPNHHVYITVGGDIVPCAYLAREINPRFTKHSQTIIPRKSFGRLADEDFRHIWHKPDYVAFRKAFREREKACRHALQVLATCDASFAALQQVDKVWETQLRQNPLPKECENCPKAYGV